MIRNTLSNTKAATFCIELPNQEQHGMPTPAGTGFFVSKDGWFVTAAHVITENNQSNNTVCVRSDLNNAWLKKESKFIEESERSFDDPMPLLDIDCYFVSFEDYIPHLDFALLKVDFSSNAKRKWLKGREGFPFINVSRRQLEEGEPIYSFGYPLSKAIFEKDEIGIVIGNSKLSPRTTSAIVSSTTEQTEAIWTPDDPQNYVLDKALNYGNSGGPIVSTQTGKVHAICSGFQPVYVPQSLHARNEKGEQLALPPIMMPSLYGIVSSLRNQEILDLLERVGVPITDE